MYPRASSRILETLTKASSQPVNLAAHFRAFGSTSRVCSATAVAPQSFRAQNRTERTEKGDLKQRNRPNYSAERSDPITNYERPSFRTSHTNRVKGKFREVHIAKKVKELCDSGDLDGAIEVCKSAPCGVQGPTAWNIVVKQALEDRRYNLAWELYQQMKKRGVGPSSVTYVTFLSAYAKASPETLTPMHLERAQKFYKSWTDLVTSARTESHLRRVTMIHPAAAYITVLANANAYQAIWDTFYELSSEGPLAPNQYVFTTMFVAFAKRGKTTHPDSDADSHLPSTTDPEVQARNASDAKLLWRMTLRALERQPFPVDAHLLTAVLRALQGGTQEEYQVAMDIIEERIVKGLEPGATLDPDLDLNPRLVDAVFAIYDSAKRPDLTQRLIDILRAQNHPHRSAVTTGAMHHLLKTYADQGDTLKIRQTIDWMLREGAIRGGLRVEPGGSTWCLAFRACLAAKDWDTTKELTKRLAGTVNSGRSIDAETIYMVLKSAYVLKPEDERSHERQLRQALDAVYYVVTLWPKNAAESYAEYASKVNPERAERRLVFQNALGDLVRRILEEFSGLSTVSSFHDLTIRLDKLRTNVSKKAVARHQDDM